MEICNLGEMPKNGHFYTLLKGFPNYVTQYMRGSIWFFLPKIFLIQLIFFFLNNKMYSNKVYKKINAKICCRQYFVYRWNSSHIFNGRISNYSAISNYQKSASQSIDIEYICEFWNLNFHRYQISCKGLFKNYITLFFGGRKGGKGGGGC